MTSETKKHISAINSGIIPDGYKKTKVGIVPIEWEIVKLKTISKHITEKNKDLKYHEIYTNSATQGVIKQTDYFDKQISNSENINGYYIVKQNDYVYNPRISVSAPCGPISKSHFSETGVMSPLYTVFRINDEYENNNYIEHYFKSSLWHRYMSGVANYGARHDRMNITNDDLFNMPIPFPPLPEQQRIAEILSTQDKLIELQERKIEQLKTLKKGCLQKMFPKKGSSVPEIRFKGFTEPWEQRELGEVIEDYVEKSIVEDQYPVLTSSQQKGIILQDDYFAGDRVSQSGNLGYFIIPRGYFTYRSRSDNSVFVFNRNDCVDMGIISYFYPVFKPKGVDSDFFLKRLNYGLEEQLKISSEGTGQHVLSLKKFKNMVSLFPTLAEQEKIGQYFHNLDTLITLHQRKLDEEKQKKKALMQLLLTGKVRVKHE